MTTEQIQRTQDKLLAIYAQGFVCDNTELWKLLGLESFEDYLKNFQTIWTPQFRYRIYILDNPQATIEQAFVRGYLIGWLLGKDTGYNNAIEDIENGVGAFV